VGIYYEEIKQKKESHMTLSKGWAEKLSNETIEKVVAIGDGHTLFEPDAYIEAGLPEDIVSGFTQTHVSQRTLNYEAVEVIAESVKGLINESGGMRAGDIDEIGWAEEIVSQLMCKDIREVSCWSPKGAIFRNGKIVESMDAVYGLEVICALANDLGVEYDQKMGRGFQYSAAAKAVADWMVGRVKTDA
jgi:hypothetical protein